MCIVFVIFSVHSVFGLFKALAFNFVSKVLNSVLKSKVEAYFFE